MYSLLFLAGVSFLWSLLLTPLVRHIFSRWGIVSRPGNERTIHNRPIPRVGGVAIAISYVLAFACLFLVNLKAGIIVRDSFDLVQRVLPAAGLIFMIGLTDDVVGLEPWHKLLGEVIAGGLAWWV